MRHRPDDVVDVAWVWTEEGSIPLDTTREDGDFGYLGDFQVLIHGAPGRVVDLRTGEPGTLPETPDPAWAPRDVLGPDDNEDRRWNLAHGEQVSVARMELAFFDGTVFSRLVARDAEGVSRMACPRTREVLFIAGGEPWSAWRDGGTLRWGRWTR